MSVFKRRRFLAEIILLCVRWYCRYGISYRDLEEMMDERGVAVDRVTLYRWVQRYAPELEKRVRWYQGYRSSSWRVDETFGHRVKILMTSTPSLAGLSRIQAAFDESDRRLFHVPCTHCGSFAPIAWGNIQWPEGEYDKAALLCGDCGGMMQHQDKPRLLRAGEWQQTAPGDGRTAGFHLSALYSPWRSWGDIATEHARVHMS